jgi:colicin import membrane protein
MTERPSDRWISLFWSVLLHGGLIGILLYGYLTYKEQPKPQVAAPAIDAMVVDSQTLAAIPAARGKPPEPAPKPPEPEPEPAPPPAEPPQPSPAEVAQQKELEQREQQEKKQAEEKQLADQARLADEKRVADERADAERKQEAEAERKAKEAADAKKREEERKLAEQKKAEDAKRLADEKRKAEEQRQEAERQSELQKSLEAEERAVALRSSGAMASWIQQITARIQRAWIKPPSARAGIDCTLLVTQVPGGEVVSVRVAACNGDEAVRESIEAAAYRASPLPPPPDPAMFDRNLEIRFRPVD